jgi:hypothetical protein
VAGQQVSQLHRKYKFINKYQIIMLKIIYKQIIFIILVFATITLCAQTPDSAAIATLQQQVCKLQIELKNQQTDFSKQLSTTNTNIGNLQLQIERQKQTIAELADTLGVKIGETVQNANEQITDINKSVSKKSLLAIGGGILLLLLSIALFIWLFKRQKMSSADIIGQLEKTKSSVEEQLVNEFAKQVEVIESLLKTIRELPVTAGNAEPDHSLALKLADEITLMERNISHMNQDTKGLKPLVRAIERLKSNLNSNGYEFVELVGKQYKEGMRITIVSSIPDENIKKGIDTITKIIKPQVNYHDKMIQMAQVEVTVGINE